MTRGDPAPGGERTLLAVLAGGALAYSLMQPLVIPALPAIQRSLHSFADATSWTVTGFLLSSAVATPIGGPPRRHVRQTPHACGGAVDRDRRNLPLRIQIVARSGRGRVVQGVSGGVLPLGYAIIRDELRPQRVARGIALLAALLGVGGGLGVLSPASLSSTCRTPRCSGSRSRPF